MDPHTNEPAEVGLEQIIRGFSTGPGPFCHLAVLVGFVAMGTGCSVLTDTSDLASKEGTSEPAIQAAAPTDGASTREPAGTTTTPTNGATDPTCQRTPVERAGPFWPHFGAMEDTSGAVWTHYSDLDDTGNTITSILGDNVSLTSVLVLSDFQVKLPANARVRGVIVDVERGGSGQVTDASVKLTHGLSRGEERASRLVWPLTAERTSYGSDMDLWGLSWTGSSLGSDLSLRIQARRVDSALATVVIDSALLWIAWDACR